MGGKRHPRVVAPATACQRLRMSTPSPTPRRRRSFAGLLLLLSGIAVMTGAEAGPEAPWYRRSLVGMEVGPTGAQFGHSDAADARYAAEFDGREIVRRCAAAGSEYVVVWARDGDYAYHDSKLLPKPVGLGSRDPLREAVEEGRRQGLPVIAYCVVQQGGHFLEAHPEFAMRGSDGKPLGRFCLRSGYLGTMKEILAEELAYGIAGFHIDMLDQGFGEPLGCWCDTCRREFQAEHGRPMPKGATWDEDWDRMLAFRYRTSERFEQALREHVRRLDPGVTVDFNYHGNPPFSYEVGQRPVQHAVNGDFNTGETGVWGFSALAVGLNAEFYRAATPAVPFQVAMQRGVRMYHDQTTRPLADLRWELSTLLAHGAFVTMIDKTGFEGRLDPVAYGRIGAAFREARAMRGHFGQGPVAEVGLYFSSRTRDWSGRERPAGYFQGFQGVHKALVHEHIPWGVVLDENADAATLARFPVVWLAGAAVLSDAEVELFRGYVEQGGKLVVTGTTGTLGWRGEKLEGSKLSGLIGAKLTGRLASLDNWFRFPAGAVAPLRGPIPEDWPFLVEGPAVVYEPTTARTMGELMRPSRTSRQRAGKEGTEWPMSPDAAVGPAILENRVGKGTVLTFAGSPDFATAGEHHIVETRRLIAQAVRHLHPTPRVRITAPATVEAVVSDDPATRTLRVHLLGYASPPQTTPAKDRPFVLPTPMEEAPMYRVALEFAADVRRAEAVDRSTVLKRKGRHVDATVQVVHEVIVVRY